MQCMNTGLELKREQSGSQLRALVEDSEPHPGSRGQKYLASDGLTMDANRISFGVLRILPQ